MDSEIKALKKNIRSAIDKLFRDQVFTDLQERCKDAVDCLSMFKILIQSKFHRDELLDKYKKFLSSLMSPSIDLIEISLENLIVVAAEVIVRPFEALFFYVKNFLSICRQENIRKLSDIIGKVAGLCFKEFIKQDDFETAWCTIIMDVFTKYQLIYDQNLFAKSFIALNICGHVKNDFRMRINREKLADLGRILFSNKRNLKFFKKACEVYFTLSIATENNSRTIERFKLNMTCSRVPSKYRGSRLINENFIFSIGITGYEKSDESIERMDGLTLIGKHQFCDIRLPENDNNIDDLSFAICHNRRFYYIIDCSNHSNVKRLLQVDESCDITNDLMVDISQVELIRFINIRSNEDDLGVITDILTYKFEAGKYAQDFGITNWELIANRADIRKRFIIGKGTEPDTSIILNREGLITGRQLIIEYLDGKWSIISPKTTNGNYFLYKNINQYKEKSFSSACLLFPRDSDYLITITFCGYNFIIVKAYDG